ncbi:MAG: hypothetical protein HPY79_05205 [Bacteroidales bacterium]|nr:hypothetical protein [Bacteroidales bacterium]
MDNKEYISEFEELLKIKDFHNNKKMKMAFDCTYEKIAKSIKEEYTQNISEKINRWVSVTHVQYFKDTKCIRYYFQAKMLYRDGFYEAAIILSRSISEMICYDLLSKTSHPFGDLDSLDIPMFRTFVDFLVIPKEIEKNDFDAQIIKKIDDLNIRNLLKSSYLLDKQNNKYYYKIENGKGKSNLKRIIEAINFVGFTKTDNFSIDTRQILHNLYDIGNLYVHSKKSKNTPQKDSYECLNMLAHILSDIYGLKSGITELTGKNIKSGYTDFPDICQGMNFAFEVAINPEDAYRIYCNIPNRIYFDKLFKSVGTWIGEWENERKEITKGILTFSLRTPEHLVANIKYERDKMEIIEELEIKLFDNYIHLIGFDEKDMKHRKGKHIYFELHFFKENLLLGENIEFSGKVIFERKS